MVINFKTIKFDRGELIASYRYLSKRWGWGVSKIDRYLAYLIKEKMIVKRLVHGNTVITITNYNQYNFLPETQQGTPPTKSDEKTEHQTEHRTEHPRSTETEHENPPPEDFSNGERNSQNPENGTPNGTPNGTKTESDRNETNKGLIKDNKKRSPTPPQVLPQVSKGPLQEEVQLQFLQRGGTIEQADKFFAKWSALGWEKNNSPIKNYTFLIGGFIDEWNKRETVQASQNSPFGEMHY